MMDVELHRVLNMVREIQKVLLPVHTTGMDVSHRGVRSLLHP
jgi:hypothetical protein